MFEGEGWKTTVNSNLTVTGVTANVIILHSRYSNIFEDNFSKSLFRITLLLFITTAFVSVSRFIAVIIKPSTNDPWKVLNKNEFT